MTDRHSSLILAAVLIVFSADIASAQVSSNQVKEAIRDGVNYLKRQQAADGSWMTWGQNEKNGVTALATFALLNAGVA
jgi:hypothetical protein